MDILGDLEGMLANIPEDVGAALRFIGQKVDELGAKLEQLAAKMEHDAAG